MSENHKVRVAIIGVGNCASSLVQGVTYYLDAKDNDAVPGLMHVNLGGYHIRDIEFTAAIDVVDTKVHKDLSEAIFACPNNTIKFTVVPHLDVPKDKYAEAGIEVLAVSADPKEKAEPDVAEMKLTLPVGYGLSMDQMKKLGLYVSEPRSPQETDRPFAEPGLFVVNPEGKVQILDISNAPFARPDLNGVLNGIIFVQSKGYPICGTLA